MMNFGAHSKTGRELGDEFVWLTNLLSPNSLPSLGHWRTAFDHSGRVDRDPAFDPRRYIGNRAIATLPLAGPSRHVPYAGGLRAGKG